MESLFNEIAGRRPEHVAKGALVYLLRKDAALVRWLASCADREVPDQAGVTVTPEVEEGAHGWRADVVIEWAGDRLSLELKLGAPFTSCQLEALATKEISLIIAPHRDISRDLTHGTRVIEWNELLSHASPTQDRGVLSAAYLLEEASASYRWYLEAITPEDVVGDAAAMFQNNKGSRPERDWTQTYKFLLQVDAHLKSMIPASWDYAPTERPLRPNKTYSHYGYYFGIDGSNADKWWIGLNRDNGELAFRLYEDEKTEKAIWRPAKTLKALDICEDIKRLVEPK